MKNHVTNITWRRALFPFIMTALSFVCFVLLYGMLLAVPFEAYHITGLFFSIPFVCFCAITILSLSGKLKATVTNSLTVTTIILSFLLVLFLIFQLTMDAFVSETSDVKHYQQVLDSVAYPAVGFFPAEIPASAQDVQFLYQSNMGGLLLSLRYRAEPERIRAYGHTLSSKAKWIGPPAALTLEESGILPSSLDALLDISEWEASDWIVYSISNRPYKPNDWNHGERGFAAVSALKQEVLFSFQHW